MSGNAEPQGEIRQGGGKARPSEWQITQRLYPVWRADPAVYAEAMRSLRALPKGSGDLEIPPWRVFGPTRVAGRVVDVASNPRNPDTVYAAAATGGVFLSTDSGSSWQAIFDDQPSLSIGDIAVDPSNPSTVWVGTGEANGGHNNLPGAGLFKSTDGGATWRLSGLENSVSIARIIVDPNNSDRIFAAVVGSYFAPGAEVGVYRSLDGGGTWTQVFMPSGSAGVIDLAIHPRQTDTLYAATWQRIRSHEEIALSGVESGIHRSYDGGETWTRLGSETGFPTGANIGRIGLTLCESQPEVLYAAINDGSRYVGIFKTLDGGDSWSDADVNRQARAATSNFSWYFGQIRVNPEDPDDVYFLDVQLSRTRDGGGTWSNQQTGLHVDYHALEFVPGQPGHLILGNDGGLGRSADDGATWGELLNLPITQFYKIDVDATNPDRVFGGTQDQGTIRRDPVSTRWEMSLGGDGFAPLIHPQDPSIVYMQTQWGDLRKSTDGGASSQRVATAAQGIDQSEQTNWSTPVVMDPSNPEVLYYGTDRVYRTDNGAQTWTAVSPRLPQRSLASPPLGTVTAIAVAPSDPSVVYAGTDDGRFWATVDPKGEWLDQTRDLPNRWITDIAVDPVDPLTAYVTFSGLKWRDPLPHVYKTTDAGNSWMDVNGNLPDAPVNAVLVDPINPSVVFVGSDIGVFVSEVGGSVWRALSEGMPAVAVYDLDIHRNSRRLFASTHGRSIFETTLPAEPVAIEPEVPSNTTGFALQAWPNPFRDKLNIQLVFDDPSASAPVEPSESIEIFDIAGRLVRQLTASTLSLSEMAEWDGRNALGEIVPAGVYLVRTNNRAGQVQTTTVVFLRHDR